MKKLSSLLSLFNDKDNRDVLSLLEQNSLKTTLTPNSHVLASSDIQVKQFEKLGLIENNDDVTRLNVVGKTLSHKLSFFEFLSKHNHFFTHHEFGDISLPFMSRLECVSECDLIEGTFPNTTRWKNIVNDAEEFLYCIFAQPPFLLADSVFEKISQGLNVFLLFGKNSDIPDCNDLVEKLELNKPKSDDKFQKRISDKIQINIIASEKEASLMLPDRMGVTDMQSSLISDNTDFLKWCHDFFNYKWNLSEPFSRLRNFTK